VKSFKSVPAGVLQLRDVSATCCRQRTWGFEDAADESAGRNPLRFMLSDGTVERRKRRKMRGLRRVGRLLSA